MSAEIVAFPSGERTGTEAPDTSAQMSRQIARFQREAETLARLGAAVYGGDCGDLIRAFSGEVVDIAVGGA